MNSAPAATKLSADPPQEGLFRIPAFDGGGAKGFYTLGVLREIEAMMNCPLYKRFDLVFGTSTGAIIAALIALGHTVDEIHDLYKAHVPTIMKKTNRHDRARALETLAIEIFGDKKFDTVKTG